MEAGTKSELKTLMGKRKGKNIHKEKNERYYVSVKRYGLTSESLQKTLPNLTTLQNAIIKAVFGFGDI